jgi:ferredoxin
MGLRLTVDTEACTGHGRCYALAPEVFAPDEFGHCELVAGAVDAEGIVPAALEAGARLGAESCPELAIKVEVTPEA